MNEIDAQFKKLKEEIKNLQYLVDGELECPTISQGQAEEFYADNPELLGEISVPDHVLINLRRLGKIGTAEIGTMTLAQLFRLME